MHSVQLLQKITIDPLDLFSPERLRPEGLWYWHADRWQSARPTLEHTFEQRQAQLERDRPPLVVLAEADPVAFVASFWAAGRRGTPLLLANPQWRTHEWQQVPVPVGYRAWGAVPPLRPTASPEQFADGMILIPTGGSQGRLRWAIHTAATLSAAVQGLRQYLQQSVLHCLSILPLYHVSGLMPVLRSLWTGGDLYLAAHLRHLRGAAQPSNLNLWLSLVPRQVQQVCEAPIPWLSQLAGIFVGGGPCWPTLLEKAAQQQLPLCLSYGMTETAGMVCAQQPGDFLGGDRACGRVLPHARIEITDSGQITVQASSLAQGYYGHPWRERVFCTDDRGKWHGDRLYIWGRASRKIISGGENIYPEELEALLLSSGWVKDVYIYSEPHPLWGEQVVAAYVPLGQVSQEQLATWLRQRCSAYKCPKRWLAYPELPRTPQGKIQLADLFKGKDCPPPADK